MARGLHQITFANALEQGDVAGVRAALAAGADPTEALARCADAETARALLAAGASPDYPPDDPPILVLVRRGRIEPLAVLIEAKADLEASSRYTEVRALMMAALHGQLVALTMLLEAGAYVDARDLAGLTALHHAAVSTQPQRRDIVVALLAANASRHARTHAQATPLELARDAGHTDLVDLLA